MNPPPLLFLDFDDVLAETRARRAAAMRGALAVVGLEITDDVFETQCAGLSWDGATRAAYRACGTGADETAIELAALRAKREFADAAARGIPLAPGARDFVLAAGASARLAIVTRAARRDVDHLLGLAGIADAFECIVCAEDYSGPEPSPVPFDYARTRMASRAPVVVGEVVGLVASLNAVAAARAARLQTVVVGPVSPTVAFAGDAYLVSLASVGPSDVVRLAAGAHSS